MKYMDIIKNRIREQIRNFNYREFVRFAIVGIIATGIHYGIYLFFSWIFQVDKTETTYLNIIYTIGYVVSWFCNLYLTAYFTFKSDVSIKRGVGFAISHVINYMLHILFLNVFLHIGVPEKWAPIPVFCVVIPINFMLVRSVFKSKYFQK